MREKKRTGNQWSLLHICLLFILNFFVSERWYCICHWEIVLWAQSFSLHENILVTCYYTAHLHSCVPTLIQSSDAGHLLAVHLCPCIFFLVITLLLIYYTCLWVYRPAVGCLWKSEDGLGKEVSPLLPPCESWGLSSSLRASAFPSWAISPALPLYSKCISCKQHIVKSAFAFVYFVFFTVLRVEPGALYLASKCLASEPYAQLFSWWWFFCFDCWVDFY